VVHFQEGLEGKEAEDGVAIEAPLEIILISGGQSLSLATLLRTPGEDFELVAGFLFSEGIIGGASDIVRMTYCTSGNPSPASGGPSRQNYNVLKVTLRGPLPDPGGARLVTTHSGCGMCSKPTLEPPVCRPPATAAIELRRDWLTQLPRQLGLAQKQFSRTGGVHGAALCAWEWGHHLGL
jgi:FdhD protein